MIGKLLGHKEVGTTGAMHTWHGKRCRSPWRESPIASPLIYWVAAIGQQ